MADGEGHSVLHFPTAVCRLGVTCCWLSNLDGRPLPTPATQASIPTAFVFPEMPVNILMLEIIVKDGC